MCLHGCMLEMYAWGEHLEKRLQRVKFGKIRPLLMRSQAECIAGKFSLRDTTLRLFRPRHFAVQGGMAPHSVAPFTRHPDIHPSDFYRHFWKSRCQHEEQQPKTLLVLATLECAHWNTYSADGRFKPRRLEDTPESAHRCRRQVLNPESFAPKPALLSTRLFYLTLIFSNSLLTVIQSRKMHCTCPVLRAVSLCSSCCYSCWTERAFWSLIQDPGNERVRVDLGIVFCWCQPYGTWAAVG